MILIDSNVLIDVLDRDPEWHDWSMDQLLLASARGRVAINHIVLAETAPHFGELAAFKGKLAEILIGIEPLTDDGAYRAGLAFIDYRKRRAAAKSVLADFLIGGHAASLGAAILTRDPRVYRSYFPSVPLITPNLPAP